MDQTEQQFVMKSEFNVIIFIFFFTLSSSENEWEVKKYGELR